MEPPRPDHPWSKCKKLGMKKTAGLVWMIKKYLKKIKKKKKINGFLKKLKWKKQRMDHTKQYGPGPNLWGSMHVSCQDSLASLSWPEAGCAKASQVGKMSKVSISDTSIFLTMNIFNMHVLYDDVEGHFMSILYRFCIPFWKGINAQRLSGRVPCKPYGRSCPP